MQAQNNNSKWVSQTLQQIGGDPDFARYQVKDTQRPKDISIIETGEVNAYQNVMVDSPNFVSLGDGLMAVVPFNATHSSINIKVYKFQDFWVLQDSFVTPQIDANNFTCTGVHMSLDKLVVTTSQYLDDGTIHPTKYISYFYIFDQALLKWVLSYNIETPSLCSAGIHKDFCFLVHTQKIDIHKFDGVWVPWDSISNTDLTSDVIDISMTDNVVCVGSPGSTQAFIYAYDGVNWAQRDIVTPSVVVTEYAISVALASETELLVTSIDAGQPPHLFIYKYDGTNWVETQVFIDNGPGSFKYGNYVRAQGDFGVVEGLDRMMYLHKNSLGIWTTNPITNSDGVGGFGKTALYGGLIGACNYGGNTVDTFLRVLTNTAQRMRTDDVVEAGKDGLLYDGISLKSGTFGSTYVDTKTIDVSSFNLDNPPIKAFFGASTVDVDIADSDGYCVGYDYILSPTSITDTNILSTEPKDDLIRTDDYLILEIDGSEYLSKATLVTVTPNVGVFDYDIQYQYPGAIPAQVKIKSRAQKQNPTYSYDFSTDVFSSTYPKIPTQGRFARVACTGDQDNILTKLSLDLETL